MRRTKTKGEILHSAACLETPDMRLVSGCSGVRCLESRDKVVFRVSTRAGGLCNSPGGGCQERDMEEREGGPI